MHSLMPSPRSSNVRSSPLRMCFSQTRNLSYISSTGKPISRMKMEMGNGRPNSAMNSHLPRSMKLSMSEFARERIRPSMAFTAFGDTDATSGNR